MKRLLALVAVLVAWASASSAQFTSNCNQQGGYPWSQGACLNASDLNNAQELSISGTPPGNITGQGANQGKLWLDTSRSPTKLRQCRAPVCSSNYVASEWRDWMPVDSNTDAIDWPIGGGAATIPASGVLDIGLYPQAVLKISGAATINSFGPTLPAGQAKILLFISASTIIYGANSIVTPTGGNITTSPGGIALVVAQGSGVYSLAYQPQVGTSPGGSPNAFQFNAGSGAFGGTSVINNAVACTDGSGTPGECRTLPGGLTYPSPVFPSSGIALAGPLITGLPNPTTADQPANKGYVDAAATGFFPHQPVTAATAAALPNSPTYNNGAGTLTAGANAALVVDGLTISALGTRVLVQTQAAAAQNGIYTLTAAGSGSVPWVLTRAADFNTAAAGNIAFGASVLVGPGGTANFSTSWTMNTTGAITVGTTALNWVQTSAPGAYTADNTSLQLTGGTFSVKPNGTFPSGLTIPGYLPVTDGLVVNTQLASMAAHTYKGNVGSSPAAPSDLTRAQLTADLNPCTATLQGLVPAPPNDATMVLDGACAFRHVVAADLAPLASALGPCPSIVLYGGVGDGSTDNTAAFNAAVTAGGSHPCVSFPGGVFKTVAGLTYTLPVASQGAITVEGAGIDTTTILPVSNGFNFGLNGTYQSVHIHNLAITTASACAGCTAISLTQNVPNTNPASSGQSDITNVAIYGADRSSAFPSGSDYFQTGVELNGISNINIVNLRVDGVQSSAGPAPGTSRGIYVHGNSSEIPVVFNFVNTTVNLYSRGLDIGDHVQGVTWVNGNLTGNMVGMYGSATAGTGNAQLSIANSGFNNCDNVYFPGPAPGTIILNNLSIIGGYLISTPQPWSCGSFTTSVDLNNGVAYAGIFGVDFGGASGWTGIHAAGVSYVSGKIAHNMFNGFGTGVDTTNPAVTVSGLLVDGNTFTANGVGIKIGATTVDAIVSNNHMQGNTADLVNNAPLGKNFIDIPQDCSGVPGVGLMFGGSNTGIIYSSSPAPACRLVVSSHRAFVDFDYTLTSKGSAPGAANAQFQLPIAPDPSVPTGMGSIAFLGAVTGLATGAVTAEMSGGLLNLWNGTVNGSTVITNSNFTNASRIKGTAVFQVPSVE